MKCKKHSLFQLCSLILLFFFVSVMNSGADERAVIKGKINTPIDAKKEAVLKQGKTEPEIANPAITKHPTDATVNADGSSFTFAITATGNPAPTYMWVVSKDNKTWTEIMSYMSAYKMTGYTAIEGLWTNKITIKYNGQLWKDLKFSCIIKNSNGTVQSNAATLKLPDPPVITKQPSNATTGEGGTATFTVTATGNPAPNYYWQHSNGASIKNSATYSGVNSSTLTVKGASAEFDNGNRYRCLVENAGGKVYSNYVTLTVGASGSSSNSGATSGTIKENLLHTTLQDKLYAMNAWRTITSIPWGSGWEGKIKSVKNTSNYPITLSIVGTNSKLEKTTVIPANTTTPNFNGLTGGVSWHAAIQSLSDNPPEGRPSIEIQWSK